MLTKQSLNLYTSEDPLGIRTTYSLRLNRIVEQSVHKGESVRYTRLSTEVKRHLLMVLWRDLYGDITKQIPELHDNCLLHLDRTTLYRDNPVEKGFQQLMQTLMPPLEWMDGMVATPLKRTQREQHAAVAK